MKVIQSMASHSGVFYCLGNILWHDQNICGIFSHINWFQKILEDIFWIYIRIIWYRSYTFQDFGCRNLVSSFPTKNVEKFFLKFNKRHIPSESSKMQMKKKIGIERQKLQKLEFGKKSEI